MFNKKKARRLDNLVKSRISMAKKKVQIQGAVILSDDWYLAYFEETKNAAQHRIWTFYEAIRLKKENFRTTDYNF